MDFDSSSKFISSLAKFLQSLCNGYVEFNSGVEVIGHIYLSVDTGKKIDYILNEKVCKTDENSVTFISNSFHAQPAEKPKPPVKPTHTSDPIKLPETTAQVDEDDIIIMDEPESKNVGTIPHRDNFHRQNASPHSKGRPSKRSFNQSFPSSHKHSSKQSRSDLSSGPNGAQLDTDSIHSESNTSSNFLPSQLASDTTIMAATESDMSHLSKVFPQNFNDSVNSQTIAEDKDIKPQLDSEMKIIQVKQEYDQPGHDGDENQESFDDSQDHSVFPGMPYDQYYGESSRRGQRLDYGHIGGMSQGEYFHVGAGPSGEAAAGDSSVPSSQSHRGKKRFSPLSSSSSLLGSYPISSTFNLSPHSLKEYQPSAPLLFQPRKSLPTGIDYMQGQQDSLVKEKRKMNFACEICGKRLPSRREYIGHMNGRHLGQKPFSCELCGRQFAYITSLPMHRKTCPAAQLAKLNSTSAVSKFPNTTSVRTPSTVDAHPTFLGNSDTLNFGSTFETPGPLPFSIHLPSSSAEGDINLSADA